MRIIKLAFAAIAAVAVCSAIVYIKEPRFSYLAYRCLAIADSPIDCLRSRPTTFRMTTLGSIYEGNTEDWIDLQVLLFGAFEKSELYFLRDVSRGGVFVDVGAHKGLYSLFMAQHSKAVHAFEPYEPVLKQFRRFVDLNAVKNISIHPVGLGDKVGKLAFEAPTSRNMGLGSFADLHDDRPHDTMEIVTGDQALQAAGVTAVDLIKMDIEGFERPALHGLAQTLAKSRPIILFELNLRANKQPFFQSMQQVRNAFPADYRFWVFKALDLYRGTYELIPVEGEIKFDSPLAQHNVIAAPAEKESRIPMKGPLRH